MKAVEIVPHGLCNGVNHAVSRALELKEVFCLHELVHNDIIIDELKSLGYRFVEDIAEIPEGATVVFSAHGVAPSVRLEARRKNLKIVDLTCPYVERAHTIAREGAMRGDEVIVLGDREHVEVRGILGELENRSEVASSGKSVIVCQTTLDEEYAEKEIGRLSKSREIAALSKPCPATKARQNAVRDFKGDAVLVLGSPQSANTRHLFEIAIESGKAAFLAGTLDQVRAIKDELESFELVGVTSGASTPERIFNETMKIMNNIPQHVAMIMDGNGRWALKRGKKRGEGHIAGAKTLSRVVGWCKDRDIKYLTVYAFSTENWKRSKEEVSGLMRLFATMMKSRESALIKNKIRFRVIGRRGDLSPSLQKTIARLEEKTAAFERQLIICISYGGRAEIIDAVNRVIERGEKVTEETFRRDLYAPDVPDPDLIIRTSGELRTSNFLLWESAYAEYFFTPTLWPDFSERDLDEALEAYSQRNRRKGAEK